MRSTFLIAAFCALVSPLFGAPPPITYTIEADYQQAQALPGQTWQQGASGSMRFVITSDGAYWDLTGLSGRWEGRSSATSTQALQQASAETNTNNIPHYFEVNIDSTETGTAYTNWVWSFITVDSGADFVIGTGRLDIAASSWTGASSVLSNTTAAAYTDAAIAGLATVYETASTNGQGTAGQVFTTDGASNNYWSTLSSGSGDMVGASNLSDVASAATSRTNLGLGTAATSDTGDFVQPTDVDYTNTAALASSATQPADLAAYVPYTGATGAVDLGTNSLTAGAATFGGEVIAGGFIESGYGEGFHITGLGADEQEPIYSNKDDQDTGMHLYRNNVIGFSTHGTNRLTIADTVITSTVPLVVEGAVTATGNAYNDPAFKLGNNTGIYGTDSLVYVAVGHPSKLYSFQQDSFSKGGASGWRLQSIVSAESAPVYSSNGDIDTGMYFPAANQLGFSTHGTNRLVLADDAATFGGDVDVGTNSIYGNWIGRTASDGIYTNGIWISQFDGVVIYGLAGDQTMGDKTLYGAWQLPTYPTSDNAVANKLYVDTEVASSGGFTGARQDLGTTNALTWLPTKYSAKWSPTAAATLAMDASAEQATYSLWQYSTNAITFNAQISLQNTITPTGTNLWIIAPADTTTNWVVVGRAF